MVVATHKNNDRLNRSLRGITLILIYLAVIATGALVVTILQPGGPF